MKHHRYLEVSGTSSVKSDSMRIASFILALALIFQCDVSAQTSTPNTTPTTGAITTSPIGTTTDKGINLAGWGGMLVGVAAVVTALSTFYVTIKSREDAKAERNAKEELERTLFKGVPIGPGERKNSVLVVGLGGSGKSALINQVIGNYSEQGSRRTERFEIRACSTTTETTGAGQVRQQTTYKYYLADYLGQNIGTLFRAFVEAQFLPNSPLAMGTIETVVFVVDLVTHQKDGAQFPPSSQHAVDEERIRETLEQWSQTAIDAVFGLLTDSLNGVCLFINKVDALDDRSGEATKRYLKCYEPLVERIRKHVDAGALPVGEAVPKDLDQSPDIAYRRGLAEGRNRARLAQARSGRTPESIVVLGSTLEGGGVDKVRALLQRCASSQS